VNVYPLSSVRVTTASIGGESPEKWWSTHD
jgi:hypothetical protein